MTDHSVERLAELAQTQRVRCRARKHKIDIAIGFEYFPYSFAHLSSPFVIAVSGRTSCIRLFQSNPGFRTNRRRIIAGKIVTNRVSAHPAFPYSEFLGLAMSAKEIA